ncbi:MAG: ABC transporter permease [Actinobacteria bacterium]|nr:ABC transporter permease [Actinomycetota bacterium]
MARSLAIARNDLRIVARDAFPVVLLVIVPFVGMVFMKPAFRPTLRAEGLAHANGAEQAVPGMLVTCGFLLVSYVGYGFYREHAWRTWERLRASPATTAEIMAGKALCSLALAALQFVLVFGAGSLLMGLDVRGSWAAVVLVGAAFGLFVVAAGLAVTAVCRTVMQANTIAYLGTLLLACLGGALVPLSLLPPWARTIAPAAPTYWAMRGYRHAIEGGAGDALAAAGVLLAGALALALVAAWRMRFEQARTGFA